MPGNLSPHTVSRLWLPRPALAACVRALLARDTRGAALDDAQRFDQLPASPLCGLFWRLDGRTEVLPPGAPASISVPRQPLPGRVVFGGPVTMPMLYWHPGPSHGLMLALAADAVHRLTGLEGADWAQRAFSCARLVAGKWSSQVPTSRR
jgi:hypothetical protein